MSAGLKLTIGAAVIVGVTLYMAYVGASSSWKYYVTAEEYLANPQAFVGQQLRVSGKVADGSLEVTGMRGDGRFSLAAGDGKAGRRVPVPAARQSGGRRGCSRRGASRRAGDPARRQSPDTVCQQVRGGLPGRRRRDCRVGQGDAVSLVGELSLLLAFVSSGYASFAAIAGRRYGNARITASAAVAAAVSFCALSSVMVILGWALVQNDFRFAYVAAYSSRWLPWHYSLSALWVGQAGSLLLWAWFAALLFLLFGYWPRQDDRTLRDHAFGIAMAYLCFLVAVMVFAADPMELSISAPRDGVGLSPLLQHPAMLVHPPIVFLGYALWTVPFALALAALACGRADAQWIRPARTWALCAWTVLGAGHPVGCQLGL